MDRLGGFLRGIVIAEIWTERFHGAGRLPQAFIRVERAFDLTKAQFSKVPAFNQADFKQAPDLDYVKYPQPPFFRFWIRGWEEEEKTTKRTEKYRVDAAKYRHLRRLAILGHDHENEAKAFKGETRAKRGTEHLPWHAAFWFGLGYDLLSDFGRSMMRPFYAWAILTALFAAVYLVNAGHTPAEWQSACPAPSHATLLSKALSLSFGNALPVVAATRGEETKAIYACLYGAAGSDGVFPIPGWSPFVQVLQNLLSALLIFLFLLGVRNQFKIK